MLVDSSAGYMYIKFMLEAPSIIPGSFISPLTESNRIESCLERDLCEI